MENQEFLYDNSNLVLNSSKAESSKFYRNTYLHLAGAILVFVLLESIFLQIPQLVNFMLSLTQGYLWIVFLGLFWLVSGIVNKFAFSLDKSKQYLGLFLYTALEGLIFVPILYMAMYYTNGGFELIKQAGIVTLFLFIGLSAVAFFSGKDFSFLKTGLTMAFFIAMGLMLAGVLFGFHLGLWFSAFMVLFAGGSILYQTSQLKYEYSTNQYVGAALGLFASFMLLFWYILRIFMSRD